MTCSAVGMFIAMATFAIFEYIKQYHTLDKTVGTTFQVISSFIYILLHSIGFQVIAMILLGELCPVKLKSLTSGIVISIESILAFGVVKIFPIALGKQQLLLNDIDSQLTITQWATARWQLLLILRPF